MDLAQVVSLVQTRLQERRPPQGPWAILPLGHCTRALKCRQNEDTKSRLQVEPQISHLERKVAGSSLAEGVSPFSYRVKVEAFHVPIRACCVQIL